MKLKLKSLFLLLAVHQMTWTVKRLDGIPILSICTKPDLVHCPDNRSCCCCLSHPPALSPPGLSRSPGVNSADTGHLAQLLPPCLKASPRSGEKLRSQFVTLKKLKCSYQKGVNQGCCWSLGHISLHHRWSSAGPMCKHYQPNSKESVVNL